MQDATSLVNEWLAAAPKQRKDAVSERLDALLDRGNAGERMVATFWPRIGSPDERQEAEAHFAQMFHDKIIDYACANPNGAVEAVRGRLAHIDVESVKAFQDVSGVPKAAEALLHCSIAAMLDDESLSRLSALSRLEISAGVGVGEKSSLPF